MKKLNIILGYVPGIHKNGNNGSYGTISRMKKNASNQSFGCR